jgi:octanoyl-[GcvH]:protein N-octanoyltransferase
VTPGGPRPVSLVLQGRPDPPALDTAVSHAILRRVAAGALPETVRLHRPADVVAFGPVDRLAPGYARAIAAVARHGFAAVERLAGGRAAVFHHGTIAFSWIRPTREGPEAIRPRFEEAAGVLVSALRRLGVDARVGAVPGEYCPGEHSINARGRVKLAGLGQRVVRGAAHVGGVVVVEGAGRIRDVLVPVYRELEIEFDPATVGATGEEAGGATWDGVAQALAVELGNRREVVPGTLDEETLALAVALVPRHRAPVPTASAPA